MLQPVIHASQPWRTSMKQLFKPVTGVLLTLGVMALGQPFSSAQAQATTTRSIQAQSSSSGQAAAQPLPDGVYLYGQAAEPEQLGSAYMVFEVNKGDVVGAFYMPRSSFDCFYGSLQPDRMALNIVNSYEQTQYPYSVALQPTDSVAMAGGEETLPAVVPEGFHKIADVSANDQRILATCQADQLTRR